MEKMKQKLEFIHLTEVKLKKQKEEERELLEKKSKEKWNKIESFRNDKKKVD